MIHRSTQVAVLILISEYTHGNQSVVMQSGKLVLVVFALAIPAPAQAAFEVQLVPGYDEKNPLAHNWCDYPTDAFIAHASNDGKLLADVQFCGTYGNGSAQAFTDKLRHHYVLIRRGTARGTHATDSDLDVYRVLPGAYHKVASFPVEEPAGVCHEVRYSYSVMGSQRGGLELHLRRQIHKDAPDCGDVPQGIIQPDLERVIQIDVPK
jgi:hypothetical protein